MTPLTTSSLPRGSGALGRGHLQPHGLTDDLRKRLQVSGGGPYLKLGIAAAMELNDDVFAAVVNFKA